LENIYGYINESAASFKAMVFFYKANQLDKFEGSGSHQNGGTRAISRYGETLRNLEIKSTFSPVGRDFNTYKCNNFHVKTAMLYSNMNSIYHVGVPMYFRKTTYRYTYNYILRLQRLEMSQLSSHV